MIFNFPSKMWVRVRAYSMEEIDAAMSGLGSKDSPNDPGIMVP